MPTKLVRYITLGGLAFASCDRADQETRTKDEDGPDGAARRSDSAHDGSAYGDPDVVERGGAQDPDERDSDAAGGDQDGGSDDFGDAGTETTTGLMARWTFDHDITRDALGSNDAICGPGICPDLDAQGVTGSALDVSPTSAAHLRVPDDGVFPLSSKFTVAAWVSYRTFAGRTCIFTKPLGLKANSFSLCANGNQAYSYMCGNECDTMTAKQPLSPGIWTHLAATFDGTTRRFYVDGLEVARSTGSIRTSKLPLVIGGDDDGAFCHTTDGLIDDVRIYSLALQPAAIQRIAKRKG